MIYAVAPKGDDPASIADLAETRLQASPYQAIRKIQCMSIGETLVLSGRLPTFFYKQIAQTAIAKIEGVKQIVNQIEVHEW